MLLRFCPLQCVYSFFLVCCPGGPTCTSAFYLCVWCWFTFLVRWMWICAAHFSLFDLVDVSAFVGAWMPLFSLSLGAVCVALHVRVRCWRLCLHALGPAGHGFFPPGGRALALSAPCGAVGWRHLSHFFFQNSLYISVTRPNVSNQEFTDWVSWI